MADVDFTKTESTDRRNVLYKWETLTDTNANGTPVRMVWNAADLVVQVVGTFATATVTMQGSLDNTNWVTLTDPSDNDLTFTAAGGSGIRDKYLWIRPSTSGGGGTQDIDVTLLVSRTLNM